MKTNSIIPVLLLTLVKILSWDSYSIHRCYIFFFFFEWFAITSIQLTYSGTMYLDAASLLRYMDSGNFFPVATLIVNLTRWRATQLSLSYYGCIWLQPYLWWHFCRLLRSWNDFGLADNTDFWSSLPSHTSTLFHAGIGFVSTLAWSPPCCDYSGDFLFNRLSHCEPESMTTNSIIPVLLPVMTFLSTPEILEWFLPS